MQLLVVRHAIAEDREVCCFKETGHGTPLTKEGVRKMKKASKGLCEIVPRIDELATSPWKRAVQTAEILAECYGVRPSQRLNWRAMKTRNLCSRGCSSSQPWT